MAMSFSKLVARAEAELPAGKTPSDEIVAVASTQLSGEGQGAAMVGGALAPLFGFWGMLLALLPFARLRVKAARNNRNPEGLSEQIHYRVFHLVFRRDRLDVYSRQRRGRFGPLVQSFPYDNMSYGRGDHPAGMAIETFLRVDDIVLPIHGWFERDLRKAIGSLGVTIEPITGPVSQIEKQLQSGEAQIAKEAT